jgi:hypothetical protein
MNRQSQPLAPEVENLVGRFAMAAALICMRGSPAQLEDLAQLMSKMLTPRLILRVNELTARIIEGGYNASSHSPYRTV